MSECAQCEQCRVWAEAYDYVLWPWQLDQIHEQLDHASDHA